MRESTDPKNGQRDENNKKVERTPEEVKQQQTDPNITELKGFTDPDEALEPKGTDNPFNE